MGVVDEAVENGVGERRAADDLVPLLDRDLAGDDGRGALMAVFEDFEEIALFVLVERGQPPIVQDQQLYARERLQQPCVATVAAGQRQRLEHAGDALIENASSFSASLMAKRASDPAFADAGRPGDQKPFGALDPAAGDELLEQRAVDAARGSQVDVFDDGVLAQSRKLQARAKTLRVALGGLAIDHQAEPLLEGESGDIGGSPLLLEGLGHAGKAKGDQAFVGGMGKHCVSFRGQWK